MRNEILTREQNADLDFLLMSLPFRNSFNYNDESKLNEFVEGFLNAVSYFGLSELEFRKKDRCEGKASFKLLKSSYNLNGVRYNKKGLKSLSIASSELKLFKSNLKIDKKNIFKDEEFKQDLLSFFVDLEIKPSDVNKLTGVLNETLKECSKGPEQTILFLQKKVEELNKLRNSPDRGAIDNIPWWKLVAIAVMIGLSVWDIWRCIYKGVCSKAEKAAIKAGYTIASLVAKFC